MGYTIIRDTREKDGQGWTWRKSTHCDGTITAKLDSGDYSLLGYESMLTIERKGCIAEWAKNITESRFEKELQRLEQIQFPFILLEFNMMDILNYPVGSGIPKPRWRYLKFNGSFILKRTTEFQMKYKTRIILCGNVGREVASNIFKRFMETIEGERSNTTES